MKHDEGGCFTFHVSRFTKSLLNEKRNAYGFYWHAVFLALAMNFTNVNTIIPAVLMSVGGTETHLGFLTAIMIGGGKVPQIFFGQMLSQKSRKKPSLLGGIYVRVFSLVALALVVQQSTTLAPGMVIVLIFVLMSVFSLSGAFAGVAYTDMLGKSIQPEERKRFFVTKQAITSVGILFSAIIARKLLTLYPVPLNYSTLFYGAGGLLLIATGGFWVLAEQSTATSEKHTKRITGKGAGIISVLKADQNLFSYLLVSNTAGISIAIIPFYIALAKTSFHLTSQAVGNYLVLQILGMIVSNAVWMKIINRTRTYKSILYVSLVLNMLLPVYALIAAQHQTAFLAVFVLAGFSLTAYEIVMSGILVEISTNENRALYTGISGTGSLLPVIFPILGGMFIAKTGYLPVFLVAVLLISVSVFFVKRIQCQKVEEEST